jgi:hypothetical protein
MFGWGRTTEVRERAAQLRTHVALLTVNLYTKSYEEFSALYRNFIENAESLNRISREINFGFKFSQSCWYDVHAEIPMERAPTMMILGGGDDYGVFITTRPDGEGAWVGP